MLSFDEKSNLWLKSFRENADLMERTVPENIEKYRQGLCRILVTDESGNPIVGKKIKVTQKTHDFKYGANIFMLDQFDNEKDNATYREEFKKYFNLATVPFFWDALEPEKGKPRYAKDSANVYRRPAPDLCLEYCEENNIAAKLHCLVFERFTPAWLPKEDEKVREAFYEERMKQISERYAGKMFEVEVINETLYERKFPKLSAISEKRDVVEWAFSLARKYFPNETLMINEAQPFFAMNTGFRHPYFMQLEKCLLNGASIDKIGCQYHVFTGSDTTTQEEYDKEVKDDAWKTDPMMSVKAARVFGELGLPMELTEVTIPTLGDTEEDEDLQAEIIKNLYSVWFSLPQISTIVYWNAVDGTAWQAPKGYPTHVTWNENACRGGLFRKDMTPKKSALALKKLFTETWHTDLELTTDACGCAEFHGFFGDYELDADGSRLKFGIHKNQSNITTVKVKI